MRIQVGLFLLANVITSNFVGSRVLADEIRIIAKQPNYLGNQFTGNPGHALIARFDDNGTLIQTKGFWPDGILTDDKNDHKTAKGLDCGVWGCKVRRARVTPNRATWIMNSIATKNFTKCYNYQGIPFGNNNCNCVTFSTRIWSKVTEGRENITGVFDPQILASRIVSLNIYGIYAYGGAIW
jgi:hypothetical protein